MHKFSTLFFVFSLFLVESYAQDSKKDARYNEILELIKTEKFEFVAQRANPQKGPQIDLTTNPNYFRVKMPVGEAALPYFGRAFSGGYSSDDGGINFNNEFESYEVERNDKKRRVTIKFTIRSESDTYNGSFTIPSLTNASLYMRSGKKQSITYSGSAYLLWKNQTRKKSRKASYAFSINTLKN